MQNKMLTPTECWEDFWEWYKTVRPARMPNELAVADLTHKGEVTKTNSRGEIVTVRLGPDRIARLLEKYAPGRYVLHPAYYTNEAEIKAALWEQYEQEKRLEKQPPKKQVPDVVPASENDLLGITKKWKHFRLVNVPASELLKLYKNGALNALAPVKKYVEARLERLEKEAAKTKAKPMNICRKLAYDSEGADEKLREIAKNKQAHKKPTRKYRCPDCGLYHLTSKA